MPTHHLHKDRRQSEMDSDSEDQTDSSLENPPDTDREDSDREENVLFVSSTISRDDTQSKEAKERVMLAQLTDKLNHGSLIRNSSGGVQAAGLGPLRTPMPPYPGITIPGFPPGVLPPQPFQPHPHAGLPPVPIPGPQLGARRPPLKANKNAKWRQNLLEKRKEPADSATGNGPDLENGGPPSQSQSVPEVNAVEVDDKVSSIQNSDLQSDSRPTADVGKPASAASRTPGEDAGNRTREGTAIGETPGPDDSNKDTIPSNLGLAESLSYIAKKHLGINMLNQSEEAARFGGYLLDTIEVLENQVSYLRARDDDDGDVTSSSSDSEDEEEVRAPHSQVLHRIYCSDRSHDHNGMIYEDEPIGKKVLTARIAIQNLTRYLSQRPLICFIIFKEHNCAVNDKVPRKRKPSQRLERLEIVSPTLQKALENVAGFSPYIQEVGDPYASVNEMDAPYAFLFHHRKQLAALEKQSNTYKAVLAPLREFLDQNYETEYQSAEALFQRGRVTPLHLEMLFKPNQIVISQLSDSGSLEAYVVSRITYRENQKIVFQGWSWQYNGIELRRKTWHGILGPVTDEEAAITELPIHPAEFAQESVLKTLETRGEKFWKMKDRQFSTYTGCDWNQDHLYVEARFMIDMSTYQKMHPNSIHTSEEPLKFDTWPVTIHKQETLSNQLMMLLPPMTHGFNLQEKRWVSLNVEKIEPAKWNKKAFDRLVLDPKTKELIYALVDVQTSKEKKMDDIITGKGNGLIILLHGSPGTGKTLTAESVAEIAEKPLYRVTCGDIGTGAQEAEKYLETVLYLGKIWDCVLLMDEADVFLEERTMADLQRNSLVSVFLRILEYYEGILILTSNRVGTFDEAFKSRIQVAIHYDNLTKRSRRKIWQNFFEMIEEANEDVNMPELERRLDELAAEEMNGRQIRNALLTSRQLAKHRKERLDWEHLSQVIKTSRDFNKYLKDVRGHSDEQWAREENIR